MTLESQLIAPSTVDPLLAKLEDPRVSEALGDLLEHADLLALLVVGLDGFVRRGDEISGALSEGIGRLRDAAPSQQLQSLDLPKLAGSLRTLSSAVADATPALETLLKSDLTDSRAIDVISVAARSLVKGAELSKSEPTPVTGVFSLLKALKDEDVGRGLGFLIQVARAFGRELRET